MHATLKNRLPIFKSSPKDAFTIVELLIIVVVLGILSAITVATVNPGEITKRSRDTIRATDIQSLNRVLQLRQAEGESSFGSPNTIYLSLPDTNANCSTYTLPTLPSGWSYACKPVSTYQNIDGTGWVPVDLTSTPNNSSIPNLPIDPVNSSVEGKFYSYISGDNWELNSTMEAQANVIGGSGDKTSTDGGDDPTRLEIGTNLTLAPWSFEFSALPTAVNNSGLPGWNNINGTGLATLSSDHTSTNFIRVTGQIWYVWQDNIPFNPESTYKMTCKVRQVSDPTAGGKGIYCGWTGVGADRITYVNVIGANNQGSQFYQVAANTSLAVSENWTTYTGYSKGWGTPNGTTSGCSNILTPCKMHANVRYIRPLFILNYSVGNGIADLDSILFTKQ